MAVWARRRAFNFFLGILTLEISGHSVGGSSSPGSRPGARGGDMMLEPAATGAVGIFQGVGFGEGIATLGLAAPGVVESFQGQAFGGGGSISADVIDRQYVGDGKEG